MLVLEMCFSKNYKVKLTNNIKPDFQTVMLWGIFVLTEHRSDDRMTRLVIKLKSS